MTPPQAAIPARRSTKLNANSLSHHDVSDHRYLERFTVRRHLRRQGKPPMTARSTATAYAVRGMKEYNVNMAATLLTAAVPPIVYFMSERLFVPGIAAGAVKG
jgi:hypothetical protein